jgi:hypothetical protein
MLFFFDMVYAVALLSTCGNCLVTNIYCMLKVETYHAYCPCLCRVVHR